MHIIIDSAGIFTVSILNSLLHPSQTVLGGHIQRLRCLCSEKQLSSYLHRCRTQHTLDDILSFLLIVSLLFFLFSQATPTVGIAFCLILVRVGGRVDQVSTITSQQTIQRIKSDDVTPSQRTEVALSPISSVQITKEVHSDSELDVTKPSVELAWKDRVREPTLNSL